MYAFPDNHFNAFFIGIAINWFHWHTDVVTAQLALWNEGKRDDSIYDATFQIAALADKLARKVA